MNEYEELLALLVRNEIRFVTVGGFACAFNGYVRPTQDVDILIDNNESNISKLLETLSKYEEGYARELTLSDFADEEGSLRIVERFPIDIFVRMSGKRYSDLAEGIRYFKIDNYDIPYLDKSRLIELKSQSLREQDRLDVIKLKEL